MKTIRELKDAIYSAVNRKRTEKNNAIAKATAYFDGYQDAMDDAFKMVEAFEKENEENT